MFSGIITTTASITQLEVERDTECVSKAVTEGLRARFFAKAKIASPSSERHFPGRGKMTAC